MANDSCFVLGLQVVIVDCHFVAMNPLYLIFVDYLLLSFLLVVFTCVFICLVLLMDGFHLDFYLQGSPLAPT